MRVSYQVHPAIGIARVGDSEDFFLGPEYGAPTEFPPQDGFRDRKGFIKRQAARFRVFRVEQADDGRIWAAEVNPRDARIEWTVELANRKGVGRRLEPNGRGPWRNVDDPKAEAAKRFIIAPAQGRITFYQPGDSEPDPPRFSRPRKLPTGQFDGEAVELGAIRVDDSGRLVVYGGKGCSARAGRNATREKDLEFADNDGWYDDTSDGKVSARIVFHDNREPVSAAPGWVIVGPPDFAPEIQNLVTLYDLARQIAICKDVRMAPARPDFNRDIRPLLHRVFSYQWVNKYAAQRHGRGCAYDFEELPFWRTLGDPRADPGQRDRLFRRLRDPCSRSEKGEATEMPRLHDDRAGFKEYNPQRVLALLPFQYRILQQWCQGDFFGVDAPDPDPPFVSLTDEIDRVAMEGCIGGPFYPGMETWEIVREEWLWAGTATDPFRLNCGDNGDPRLVPGLLTEGNAVPWQADFLDCAWEDGAGWWPAQRPDHVRVHPDRDEMHDWAFGIDGSPGRPGGPIAHDMIDHWRHLGFVLKARDLRGRDVFVESSRDPNHVLPPRP